MPMITGGFVRSSFFTTDTADDAATELTQARQHFFRPGATVTRSARTRSSTSMNALLMVETRDAPATASR
jgi:hypothetical protein